MAPSSQTSRNRSLSSPACGTRAEWNFSEPERDCRHWKKPMVSAPRATWVSESRMVPTGHLGGVDRLPVHRAGRVLHEQPRAPTGQATGQVAGEGQLGAGVGEGVDDVVVGAHDVLERGPVVVVEQPEVVERHEVGRDRQVGGVPPDHLVLGTVELEQGVGAEPGVVEHVGGVVERRGAPRREDVVVGRVALAPERRSPGVVERRRACRSGAAASWRKAMAQVSQ